MSYSDDAPGRSKPYSQDYHIKYVNISLGHKFTFDKGQIVKPYLENNVIIDKKLKNEKIGHLFYLGISLKSELGLEFDIIKQLNLSLGIFYKSAIYSYGGAYILKYQRHYQFMPYAYGVELGVATKL